jgi:hypothetical protein
MGRINKRVLVDDIRPSEIGYPGYGGCPSQPWRNAPILLVNWLNGALLGSPVEREAARQVGGLIEGVTDCRHRTTRAMWFGERPRDGHLPSYRLQDIAPYYRFTFDLYPIGESGKWELSLYCVYATPGDRQQSRGGSDQESRLELEAAAMVVDLALDGRLAKIKRCQVPDCGKWFVTRRNFRFSRCKDCRLHDRRKETPERKAQRRAASENREPEKKKNERSVKNARKFLADGRKKK